MKIDVDEMKTGQAVADRIRGLGQGPARIDFFQGFRSETSRSSSQLAGQLPDGVGNSALDPDLKELAALLEQRKAVAHRLRRLEDSEARLSGMFSREPRNAPVLFDPGQEIEEAYRSDV